MDGPFDGYLYKIRALSHSGYIQITATPWKFDSRSSTGKRVHHISDSVIVKPPTTWQRLVGITFAKKVRKELRRLKEEHRQELLAYHRAKAVAEQIIQEEETT